ncbi:membrane protein [Salmonella enterica subsp. enterica]|uniref:Membrane protein n=1 Tax=Salmonella enterica I TaxID=59201 RepID=A0A447N0M3_SALET|nr:membrane protein [Salmonella enterica subsp. enterica]
MTEAENAVAIVKEFLVASMIPDAERAATYMHPEVKITFTGRPGRWRARQISRSLTALATSG